MFDFGSANEEQKQAIVTTEGPVLIIAGPGTGKTFTLVKRIAYLVFEKKIKPNEIMIVTFTEKAAKELLTRISNEFVSCNFNINEMYIGTFHSVCLRLLKENVENVKNNKKSRIMDAFEQTYFVCKNIESFNSLSKFNEHIPRSLGIWRQALEVCRYVNQMQEELVDIEAMQHDKDEDVRFLAKLVIRYKELLERNHLMDFSSIQIEMYELFLYKPDVLKKIQESIKYIMVDEYQDTNYIQEQLIFQMAGNKRNICVVGDDDQGMYRFRGATIRNILEFPNQFSKGECTIVHLNKNYRSEPGIIQFYNNWMQSVNGSSLFHWGNCRYEKQITTAKQKVQLGESVFRCGGNSIEREKEDLLKTIIRLKQNGNITDYNQVAFLFRSVKSEEAVMLGKYFEENGIPVYSPRSDMFFERIEVKQLFGCLITCFTSYLQDLKKNMFLHTISEELRTYYISCVKEAMILMKADKGLYDYIDVQRKSIQLLSEDSELGLLDIFYKLISFEPFRGYLNVSLKENVWKTRAARNLSEISRMLSKYSFLHEMHKITLQNKIALPEELFNLYLNYLYIDGIGEYEDESEYAPSGCVSFMTIHQSKGLEFPVVVVGSLGNTPRRTRDSLMYTAENRFFHRTPFEPIADIKYFDFWRLYYVAFSRAQNLLVLATQKEENKIFSMYLNPLSNIENYNESIAFDKVKKVNYKQVYSFTSHILVYHTCPIQYKFYKEYAFVQSQMFHTSIGSLVHATLEDINKCMIHGECVRVTEDMIKEWFWINYQTMQKQTGYFLTEEQQNSALSQVIRYYQYRKNTLGRIWKAEEEINLVLPNYILQGVIDLVEGEGDTVEIIDYKTGSKPDMKKHPERVEQYKKQLEVYAYLMEQRYGKKVSRMHLYYTSTLEENPMISFEWKKEDIEQTVEEITKTVEQIEKKEFEGKGQNQNTCKFCDMKYVCGKDVI